LVSVNLSEFVLGAVLRSAALA